MPAHLKCHEFSVPKRGKKTTENEDRFAINRPKGRFAIADGATESSFAASWAELLVKRFMDDTSIMKGEPWEPWLAPIQAAWQAEVEKRDIPWFAEEKVALGGFAAFLGLVIRPDNTWRALAVGDCCLFQFRNNRPRQWFPFRELHEFPQRPWLLGSRTKAAEIAGHEFHSDKVLAPWLGEPTDEAPDAKPRRPDWQCGDEFVLATDALSKWFVQQITLHWDDPDAPEFHFPRTKQEFEEFVEQGRENKELENDDVTMVRISLLELQAPAAPPEDKAPAAPPPEDNVPMAEIVDEAPTEAKPAEPPAEGQ